MDTDTKNVPQLFLPTETQEKDQKLEIDLRQEDLIRAARLQVVGQVELVGFDQRVVPKANFKNLILPKPLMKTVKNILRLQKAQKVLSTEWGFNNLSGYDTGTTVFFIGTPGTGKSMTAEVLGYELGRPLKILPCTLLVKQSHIGSNLHSNLFKELRNSGAIVVIEGCECLLHYGYDETHQQHVSALNHWLSQMTGLVVLIATTRDTGSVLGNVPKELKQRVRYICEYKPPDKELRLALWKALTPTEAPLSSDVDFSLLAQKYEFVGQNIKNCILNAASRAALRLPKAQITSSSQSSFSSTSSRSITMKDLIWACKEEYNKVNLRTHSNMVM